MPKNDTELVIKINGNIKGYQDALKSATAETEDLQNRFNTIAKTGAIAFAGLGGAIALAAGQAAKFETIETQFVTLTGSAKEAQKTIKELSDFAAKTPFQFEQIAQAAKQLISFRITGDELRPTLKAIGDVAAATGAQFGDLTLIFGQVRAAGKLTGERLLQLEERAVPIGPALAKTMGVAESAIRDLVSKGEVDFKTFQKAFASLSQEGGLAFEGMEKRSQTLEGQLSTLADNFQLLTVAVGKDFLPALKTLAGTMTNFLNFLRENPGLSEFISRALVAGTVVGGLATAVGIAGTVFLKLRASMIASAIAAKGLSFAVKGLVGATGLGLLIAFLPEIIDVFQWVFPRAKAIFLGFATGVTEIAKGLLNIFGGVFGLDLDAIKKGLNQLKNAVSKGAEEAAKEFEKIDKAAKKSSEETAKAGEDAAKATEENQKKQTEAAVKGADQRIQKLKDENALIKAELDGQTREQLAILKKRQEISRKQKDAEIIQDDARRKLALENIKLLNQQLDKVEADAQTAREKKQAEKDAKAQERASKEQERVAERIQILENENELTKAALKKRSSEEIGFLRQRQEIRDQVREAEKTKNEEERNLILENAMLKHERLLEAEQEFFARRDEVRAEQTEAEAAVAAELEMLSEEQRRAFRQRDIEELISSFETKRQIELKAGKQRIADKRKEDALFLQDQEKFGKIYANLRKFFRQEEVKGARDTVSQLSQLQSSQNETQKTIGKAAALVQIGISTQEGAIKAYTALAGIPIVGPALGTAAAAALIAYGAERAARVQAFQSGGFVQGTGGIDSQIIAASPREFIVPPQTAEEVINAVAEKRVVERELEAGVAESEEAAPREFVFGFTEEAADFLTVKQNEDSFLGVSQQIKGFA